MSEKEVGVSWNGRLRVWGETQKWARRGVMSSVLLVAFALACVITGGQGQIVSSAPPQSTRRNTWTLRYNAFNLPGLGRKLQGTGRQALQMNEYSCATLQSKSNADLEPFTAYVIERISAAAGLNPNYFTVILGLTCTSLSAGDPPIGRLIASFVVDISDSSLSDACDSTDDAQGVVRSIFTSPGGLNTILEPGVELLERSFQELALDIVPFVEPVCPPTDDCTCDLAQLPPEQVRFTGSPNDGNKRHNWISYCEGQVTNYDALGAGPLPGFASQRGNFAGKCRQCLDVHAANFGSSPTEADAALQRCLACVRFSICARRGDSTDLGNWRVDWRANMADRCAPLMQDRLQRPNSEPDAGFKTTCICDLLEYWPSQAVPSSEQLQQPIVYQDGKCLSAQCIQQVDCVVAEATRNERFEELLCRLGANIAGQVFTDPTDPTTVLPVADWLWTAGANGQTTRAGRVDSCLQSRSCAAPCSIP